MAALRLGLGLGLHGRSTGAGFDPLSLFENNETGFLLLGSDISADAEANVSSWPTADLPDGATKNGTAMAQATSANQPTFRGSGAGGPARIKITPTNFMDLDNTAMSPPYSVFVVFRRLIDNNVSLSTILRSNTYGAGLVFGTTGGDENKLFGYAGQTGGGTPLTDDIPRDEWVVGGVSVASDGTTTIFDSAQTEVQTADGTPEDLKAATRIGAQSPPGTSRPATIMVGAAGALDRELTSDEITSLRSWAATLGGSGDPNPSDLMDTAPTDVGAQPWNHVSIPTIAKTAGGREWAAFFVGAADANDTSVRSFAIVYRDSGDPNWTLFKYVGQNNNNDARVADLILYIDSNDVLWALAWLDVKDFPYDNACRNFVWTCADPDAATPAFSSRREIGAFGTVDGFFDLGGAPHVVNCVWQDALASDYPTWQPIPTQGCFARPLDLSGLTITESTAVTFPDITSEGFTYGFDEISAVELSTPGDLFAVRRFQGQVAYAKRTSGTWGLWTNITTLGAFSATTSSKPALVKMPDGKIVLIANNSSARENLTLAVSDDDGATFPASQSKLLMAGPTVSYPKAIVDPADSDKLIIVHDHDRHTSQTGGDRQIVRHEISIADVFANGSGATLTTEYITNLGVLQ